MVDPYSIQIFAVIEVDSTGEKYTLWDKVYSFGGQSFPGSRDESFNLPIVTSVSIESALGLVSTANIEISTTFELGVKLLESELFKVGNKASIRMGYTNAALYTPWFTGTVQQPTINISPEDGLSVTIPLQGDGVWASRSSTNDGRTGERYIDIVEEFAEKYGFKLLYGSTVPEDATESAQEGLSADVYKNYVARRESVSRGAMVDMQFIRWIMRTLGVEVITASYNGDDVLILADRSKITGFQPRYELVFRGRSDFKTRFPILGFSSEAEFVWLPSGARRVQSRDLNPDTRQEEVDEASPETSSMHGVGGDATVVNRNESEPGRSQDGSVERVEPVSSRHPSGKANVTQAAHDEERIRGSLHAEIETVGNPLISPGMLVKVSGISVFDGNYQVISVTHQAGEGEFTTTMKVVRTALNRDMITPAFREAAGLDENTQSPERQEEAEGGGVEVQPQEEG